MPVTELLLDGLRLMAIGMGIVFLFLLLLIGILRLLSGAVSRFAPEPPATIAHPPLAGEIQDPERIAVIAAAIARYRADHRRF